MRSTVDRVSVERRPLSLTARVVRGLHHRLFKQDLFYVVSHERSGTHFLINLLLRNMQIRRGNGYGLHSGEGWHNIGEWYGPYDTPDARMQPIADFVERWDEAATAASIVKSHCDHDLFAEYYRPARVVYLLRDPRDVMTSWYHYLTNNEFLSQKLAESGFRPRSMSQFLNEPLPPFLRYSYSLRGAFNNVVDRWAAHVQGWMADPQALVVRYEDLKSDFRTQVERVAAFVGVRLRRELQTVGLHEGYSVMPRKGKIGDWQNDLCREDTAFIEDICRTAGLDWDTVAWPSGTATDRSAASWT